MDPTGLAQQADRWEAALQRAKSEYRIKGSQRSRSPREQPGVGRPALPGRGVLSLPRGDRLGDEGAHCPSPPGGEGRGEGRT